MKDEPRYLGVVIVVRADRSGCLGLLIGIRPRSMHADF